MKPAFLRPAAARDLEESRDWYDGQAPGLGQAFLTEFRAALERIRSGPAAYPVAHADIRRAPLRRFPYSVLFRDLSEAVVVVAVFHGKRHPVGFKRRR